MAKLVKPDKRGINKLIEVIENAPGKYTKMGSFAKDICDKSGDVCGTAYCIAGWAHSIRAGQGHEFESYMDSLAKLVYPRHSFSRVEEIIFPLWAGEGISLERFDELSPAIRKRSALGVLRHFRDTGIVDWRKFTPKKAWI